MARFVPGKNDVLIAVDLQYDFCPGGALAVPGGEEIVPVINRLAASFSQVVLTQDWHTPGHASFASSHPGCKPFETIPMPYGQQVLWPDHCVQGTRGAAFRIELDIPHAQMVIRKGCHPHIDSYSAFFENDHETPTGLAGYLRERGTKRVFLAGLALDFCVFWSAMDAIDLGFETVVIEDACRAIDLDDSLAAARRAMVEAGVETAAAAEIAAG